MKVVLPELQKYQRDVYDFILESPKDNIVVIKSPRQVGKSVFLEILLIARSLMQPNSISIAVSPISKQSRKLYTEIASIASPLIKSANSSIFEITFINGSVIQFLSGESGDNNRGFTCKGTGIVVVDECAYIDGDLFWNVITPFVNVSHNDIVVASTPKFTLGLFYELFCNGEEGLKGYKTFDWTKYDLSKFLTLDLLDRYSKSMPRRAFTTEYLGLFISGEGMLFTNISGCIGESHLVPEQELMITADWGSGTGNDDTVLTVGQSYEDHIYVLEQNAFNDKGTNETIQIIIDTIKQYVARGCKSISLLVESNSIGNIYYSSLVDAVDEYETRYNDDVNWRDEIEISIGKFTTTNLSKKRIVEETMLAFENKSITIPDIQKLKKQLTTFECKTNDNGLITYGNHKDSDHDDCVMSLCFLVDLAQNFSATRLKK